METQGLSEPTRKVADFSGLDNNDLFSSGDSHVNETRDLSEHVVDKNFFNNFEDDFDDDNLD